MRQKKSGQDTARFPGSPVFPACMGNGNKKKRYGLSCMATAFPAAVTAADCMAWSRSSLSGLSF